MNTEAKSAKSNLAADTSWAGNMELANNTGSTINSITFEHKCPQVDPTGLMFTPLANNGDSQVVPFATVANQPDHWLVSFLDGSNNLKIGALAMPFHIASAGSTVEISLFPTTFTVTISGITQTGNYLL